MAGRPMGKRHQEDIRAKIQAAHIVGRFQKAFDGEIELTSDQINIGKALLNKSLPDLKAIEHSGDPDNPLGVINKVEIHVVDSQSTSTENLPASDEASKV